VGDAIVGNPPGPGHQIAEIEGHRFAPGVAGDQAELIGQIQQLLHERLTEARILGDLLLAFGPGGNRRAIGRIAPVPCLDGLQGTQSMGQ